MNKKSFTGWNIIYKFTINQSMKTKGFKIAMFLVVGLIFLSFFSMNFVYGIVKNHKKEKQHKEIKIETIFIEDNTEDVIGDGEKLIEYINGSTTKYNVNEIKVLSNKSVAESIKELVEDESEKDNKYMGIVVGFNDEKLSYTVDIYLSDNLSKSKTKKLTEIISEYINIKKINTVSKNDADIAFLNCETIVSTKNVDEKTKSIGVEVLEMLLPMLVVLLMYLLVMLHGTTVSQNLIIEKNSKLMEYMLTTVKPYGMVFGKVFAIYSIAVLELCSWIISGIAGYSIGLFVTKKMYSDFKCPYTAVFDEIKKGAADAFSVKTYILTIVALLIGFLTYCVLAALVSSGATKAEELANYMSIFQMVSMIGYLASYFVPLMEFDEKIISIFRFIPVTAAFMLPTDILLGNISILYGILSIGILVACNVVMIIFTGKIYKKKLF